MSHHVIGSQPQRRRIQEGAQWSTGLCACHQDVGDCKCTGGVGDITYDDPSGCWGWGWGGGAQMTSCMTTPVGVCAGCFALCCLPVFTCKVARKAGVCPLLPLLDCLGCVPPASLAVRASVREKYGIQVRPLQKSFEIWD